MNRTRLLRIVVFLTLVLAIFSTLSCSINPGSDGAEKEAPSISKPQPSVASISTATSGMGDSYYAIMEVTVKNEGAAGTVLVVGTMTQGGETTENTFPVNLKKNSVMVVPLVFKLKWRGGEFTPKAEVEIP